jgi:short-subunit dehydrogenase
MGQHRIVRKAIVIGATSGIGQGVARLLAEHGYKVGITGRRTEFLRQLEKERPGSYISCEMDITFPEQTIAGLQKLILQMGGVELILISSGTGDLNDTLEFSIEKRTTDTNVTGFTALADWIFNYFRQKGSGHLAAITSIAGIRGSRHAPAYMASKAYQISYLESLSQKATFLKVPIIVTDIRPGFVNTAMAKGEGQFWVVSADKASRQIFRALMQKRRIVYISRRWALIALVLKLLPGIIYRHV